MSEMHLYCKTFFSKSFYISIIYDPLTFQININQLGKSIDSDIFYK